MHIQTLLILPIIILFKKLIDPNVLYTRSKE